MWQRLSTAKALSLALFPGADLSLMFYDASAWRSGRPDGSAVDVKISVGGGAAETLASGFRTSVPPYDAGRRGRGPFAFEMTSWIVGPRAGFYALKTALPREPPHLAGGPVLEHRLGRERQAGRPYPDRNRATGGLPRAIPASPGARRRPVLGQAAPRESAGIDVAVRTDTAPWAAEDLASAESAPEERPHPFGALGIIPGLLAVLGAAWASVPPPL